MVAHYRGLCSPTCVGYYLYTISCSRNVRVYYLLQISTLFEVIPTWLPPVAIAIGFALVSVGMGRRYLEATLGYRNEYPSRAGLLLILCLTLSVGEAVYMTIQRQELLLMFVYFIFISGKIVQGAITTYLLQKVLDFFFSSSSVSESGYVITVWRYIKTKLKERFILFLATGTITIHTSMSIVAVYAIGSGETIDAIERFWIGFFFLTVIGMIFDFRHFAHRISWTAALGLIIAVTGAFLFNPAGFSSLTVVLAPYLQNPIPDWMRWPLGAIGFFFGVLLWAVFYWKEV